MIKKLIKCEKGSIIIELGIFLPLLLSLVVGYMMFINAIRSDIVLQIAAREGAREYAATHSIVRAKEAATLQVELAGMDISDIVIDTKERINSYGEKERIVVVKRPMGFHVPFVGDMDITLQRGAMFYAEKTY